MSEKKSAYLLCIDNGSYPASLELHKAYRVVPDRKAASHDLLRVVDESGEDYLYPASSFVRLPSSLQRVLARAS